MSEKKTILIGLGAAKSGTTWLYHQLKEHPACSVKSIKELHFFDIAEGAGLKKLIQKNISALATVQKKIEQGNTSSYLDRRQKDLIGWLEIVGGKNHDTEAYLKYILDGMSPTQTLAADITPSYALLPAGRLKEISEMSQDVRFLYLMRDPVSRLWSNIRMAANNMAEHEESRARLASSLLNRVLSGDETSSAKRSDYASAIDKFSSVIPRKNLMIMFYEDLMSQAGFDNLCSFLGIAPVSPDFTKRIHGGIDLKMTLEQTELLRKHLTDQYAFALSQFGELPDAWQRNMI